jgi:hypothetical protein
MPAGLVRLEPTWCHIDDRARATLPNRGNANDAILS